VLHAVLGVGEGDEGEVPDGEPDVTETDADVGNEDDGDDGDDEDDEDVGADEGGAVAVEVRGNPDEPVAMGGLGDTESWEPGELVDPTEGAVDAEAAGLLAVPDPEADELDPWIANSGLMLPESPKRTRIYVVRVTTDGTTMLAFSSVRLNPEAKMVDRCSPAELGSR